MLVDAVFPESLQHATSEETTLWKNLIKAICWVFAACWKKGNFLRGSLWISAHPAAQPLSMSLTKTARAIEPEGCQETGALLRSFVCLDCETTARALAAGLQKRAQKEIPATGNAQIFKPRSRSVSLSQWNGRHCPANKPECLGWTNSQRDQSKNLHISSSGINQARATARHFINRDH